MPENQDTNGTPAENETFAELFESYEAGMSDNIKVGDKISGRVISVDGSNVYVETGSKVDGVAELEEFLDEEGKPEIAEGDTVELYVTATSASEIKLSKALSGQGGVEILREAYETKVPVEGKVSGTCKGGFNVEMAKRRVFCPISQIDNHFVEDAEAFVGETLPFLIIKFEENGRNIVVSRRELLMLEQEEAAASFVDSVSEGAIAEGKVVRLAPFGAFVELVPGVEGMVHVSELGWGRVDDPGDILKPGETVRAKILEIKQDAKGKLRISLSMKQAMTDPWDDLPEFIKPGEHVKGTVTRIAPFGAFIELAPGLEGLVHLSEMSYTKRVMKAEEIVSPGDELMVAVKDVDTEKRRISLSIKAAEGDPWSDVAELFAVGQMVDGTVEKREQFGIFITLAPGITGLLPKSRYARAKNAGDFEKMVPGDPIKVKVTEIRPNERKVTLGLEGQEEGESQNKDWKRYNKPSDSKPMGLLGEKLQQAMKAKKK
ncbi:MAG: 30S ribosomal protein S1 [Desulfovibrio sp.]|uniref:30S ribosomal protein S1 n=1 Tax=Desulfovibrio sp. 7SRBS1 TaxID=3378064 RepID=UPI003B403DB0